MRIFKSEDLPVIRTKDHEELVRYISSPYYIERYIDGFVVTRISPLTLVRGLCILNGVNQEKCKHPCGKAQNKGEDYHDRNNKQKQQKDT